MNYMANAKNKKKEKNNKIVIGIVIAICLFVSIYLLSIMKIPVISNFFGKITYGIDAVASSISGVIKNGSSYFGNTKKLNDKVNELNEELAKTKISLQELETLKVKNNDLQDLLKIEDKYHHFDKIYANVITRSYDNWNETFVINKGSNDGIKLKHTVIAEDGLVGYISAVTELSSTVTTILDPSSSVSVEISNINSLALAKGDFDLKDRSELKLINIPIDTEIAKNETIYTSGIGGLYEKGIPIGTIEKITNNKNEIDRYGIVKLFVKLDSIDMVGVIVN